MVVLWLNILSPSLSLFLHLRDIYIFLPYIYIYAGAALHLLAPLHVHRRADGPHPSAHRGGELNLRRVNPDFNPNRVNPNFNPNQGEP